MQKILIIILVSIILSSCFEKDKMLPVPIPGEAQTVVIPLTNYYTNQVYFNLESGEMTGINNRSDFDLNFICDENSTIIRLNTSNFCLAAITQHEKFEDVSDTIGLDWRFDGSSGDVDSLAIYNWINIDGSDTSYTNKVWVINRGISALGVQLGLIKVKFEKLADNKFHISYSNMDNTGFKSNIIEKDFDYLYKQFSFVSDSVKQLEPIVSDWDLIFTQYTTMLYTNEGDVYPYLVTGALQQYNIVSVALDTSLVFEDIDISDTLQLNFSTNFDKIGYNWKELIGDVNSGAVSYQVRLNNNYIIKNRNSRYYKLRFVNFYNPSTDEKGYPTFEYLEL